MSGGRCQALRATHILGDGFSGVRVQVFAMCDDFMTQNFRFPWQVAPPRACWWRRGMVADACAAGTDSEASLMHAMLMHCIHALRDEEVLGVSGWWHPPPPHQVDDVARCVAAHPLGPRHPAAQARSRHPLHLAHAASGGHTSWRTMHFQKSKKSCLGKSVSS